MSDNIQSPRFKFNPDYAVPPGETLKEVLEDRKISFPELAKRCGLSFATLAGILSGSTAINQDIAARFEKALGTPASFWIRREEVYRKGIKRNA